MIYLFFGPSPSPEKNAQATPVNLHKSSDDLADRRVSSPCSFLNVCSLSLSVCVCCLRHETTDEPFRTLRLHSHDVVLSPRPFFPNIFPWIEVEIVPTLIPDYAP